MRQIIVIHRQRISHHNLSAAFRLPHRVFTNARETIPRTAHQTGNRWLTTYLFSPHFMNEQTQGNTICRTLISLTALLSHTRNNAQSFAKSKLCSKPRGGRSNPQIPFCQTIYLDRYLSTNLYRTRKHVVRSPNNQDIQIPRCTCAPSK
jgi:hypothetical protein